MFNVLGNSPFVMQRACRSKIESQNFRNVSFLLSARAVAPLQVLQIARPNKFSKFLGSLKSRLQDFIMSSEVCEFTWTLQDLYEVIFDDGNGKQRPFPLKAHYLFFRQEANGREFPDGDARPKNLPMVISSQIPSQIDVISNGLTYF